MLKLGYKTDVICHAFESERDCIDKYIAQPEAMIVTEKKKTGK